MKNLAMAMLIAAVALWAAPAICQPAPEDQPHQGEVRHPEGPPGPVRSAPDDPGRLEAQARPPDERLDALIESLKLPEEQAAQVRKILIRHAQAVAEWHRDRAEQTKELQRRLMQAKEAGDREAAQDVQRQLEQLQRPREEQTHAAIDKLGGLLNERQMARVREFLSPPPLKRPEQIGPLGPPPPNRPDQAGPPGGGVLGELRRLDLTRKQQEQIRRIIADAQAQALRRAMRRIRAEVLTDQQRSRLGDHLRLRDGERGGPHIGPPGPPRGPVDRFRYRGREPQPPVEPRHEPERQWRDEED